MVDASQYQVGDTVIIGKHPEGPGYGWVPYMDQFIGKKATLIEPCCHSTGYWLWRTSLPTIHNFEERAFNKCPCPKVSNCLYHTGKRKAI